VSTWFVDPATPFFKLQDSDGAKTLKARGIVWQKAWYCVQPVDQVDTNRENESSIAFSNVILCGGGFGHVAGCPIYLITITFFTCRGTPLHFWLWAWCPLWYIASSIKLWFKVLINVMCRFNFSWVNPGLSKWHFFFFSWNSSDVQL
jgi:hypothetical protein